MSCWTSSPTPGRNPRSSCSVGSRGGTLPWSGGGYFRVIPYAWFRWGVARRLRTRSWFMFYFHPWELDGDEAPPPGLPTWLKARAYTGRRRMRRDLRQLLTEFGSARIDQT